MNEINVITDIFGDFNNAASCSCTVPVQGQGTVIADYFIEVPHP